MIAVILLATHTTSVAKRYIMMSRVIALFHDKRPGRT